jgi:hypothetical protein
MELLLWITPNLRVLYVAKAKNNVLSKVEQSPFRRTIPKVKWLTKASKFDLCNIELDFLGIKKEEPKLLF